MPWLASSQPDLLPAEFGRELGHSPALVNKLLCCPECVVLPEGCCFLAPHHHLCNTSQGGFCPFSFFFFGLYRKSLDQARRGADRQPLAPASPTASHSGQPGKARMSCLFVRAGSPHSCSTDLFLSDGTGARSRAVATVVQALQSVPGVSQAAGFSLDLFSAGKQLCPEVCAYSALLAPCPLQSPQVFQASPAPPGLAVTLRHNLRSVPLDLLLVT